MSTFELEAPRSGRWVRRGRTVVLPDPWSAAAGDAPEAEDWAAEEEVTTPDVAWVQRTLNQVAGAGLAVDGIMGPRTSAAVVDFQRRHGLVADGIVGPLTTAALQAASSSAHPAPAAPPSSAPAPATGTADVGTFDGKPVARWLIPYLSWARDHGWTGRLNSGWRDPAYSEQLCMSICGAPTCPLRCAGRLSNHSGSVKPKGAIDVSEYVQFGQLMAVCPLQPRIFNDLPSDLVHFSATGH